MFEIPFLTVYLVKKNVFGRSKGGHGHGRPKYATERNTWYNMINNIRLKARRYGRAFWHSWEGGGFSYV